MSTISKLTKNLETKYKVYSFLCPLTMIGEVLMETAIPLMMAQIIDVGIANADFNFVLKTGLIMFAMAAFSLLCGALGARLGAVAAVGFSHNVRRNLFAKIQDFSFGNVDNFSSSSLVTRLTTDCTNLQNTYQMLIRICIRAPFMLISGTILACFINKELSLIFAVAIPFVALVLFFLAKKGFPMFAKMLGFYDKLNNAVQENLSAIRVVKSYVRGDFENQKFDDCAKSLKNAQVRAEKLIIFTSPMMQMVIYVSIIAALWFGGRMIVFGSMKTGELVSFISYIGQILMSLMMVSIVFIGVVLSKASINRIVAVLDEVPEIQNPADEICVKNVKDASLDFENVYFSYSHDKNNCVLSNINFHVDSGKMIGILGGTGSSKTTLVSLIPRLYDCLEGSVKVGGVDVRNYDLTVLRDNVSMVLQNNVLFSGTIKDNLRWGNQNASEDEIINACKIADAHEFVSSLPNGYETELGQGGVNLSGGQKQRLCIARALLKKPKILILDDSTSAVDTATDSRIRSALRENLKDSTKIIIAQRISSVQDADFIYVLDNGQINGCGTHEELLASNEIYREVYESQQSSS